MIDTVYHTHPVLAIIGIWCALEFIAYALISTAMSWRSLCHSFSWPFRAVRMARRFF